MYIKAKIKLTSTQYFIPLLQTGNNYKKVCLHSHPSIGRNALRNTELWFSCNDCVNKYTDIAFLLILLRYSDAIQTKYVCIAFVVKVP